MNQNERVGLRAKPAKAPDSDSVAQAAAAVGVLLRAADGNFSSMTSMDPRRPKGPFKGAWTQRRPGTRFERQRLMRVELGFLIQERT